MAHSNVDVVVLGMGVGGEMAADSLAVAGLDVVGVEQRLVGGECPYFACIPTKMMVRAGDALAEARRLPRLAGEADVRSDWRLVADRIRDEATTDWDDQIAVDRFTGKGGRFVRGHGRLTAPDEVRVDGDSFQARRGIVLATGSAPQVPPIPGLDRVRYWTNRDAVRATEPPSHRPRCWCWVLARSGSSSRRRSPGSVRGSRWWRLRSGHSRPRSQRRARSWSSPWPMTGSRCVPAPR
jgi:pyruvate/2-oxoglutarate dehydrogenase complex dihydrolipoamide dehydrogenase (E3) component